ncbi:hypothetical protein [Duganella sp. Leaf126]|uniref:hypothetical protein n=1 Tax=Duganella sp. Leaf126 TaxID=1736266 RepID=UPI0006FDCBA0|nr:hypothetical protein [Duganella sp. Leaf126]
MNAPEDHAPQWKTTKYATMSLDEFDRLAPELHRRAKEHGGTLLVIEGRRVRMELKYHDLGPVPASDTLKSSVVYEGDIVSPIEADGYAPFK